MNDEKGWVVFIMMGVYAVIITTAFAASHNENTRLKKELAEMSIAAQKTTAEQSNKYSSCFKMMKDPVVRRIMCNKDHF